MPLSLSLVPNFYISPSSQLLYPQYRTRNSNLLSVHSCCLYSSANSCCPCTLCQILRLSSKKQALLYEIMAWYLQTWAKPTSFFPSPPSEKQANCISFNFLKPPPKHTECETLIAINSIAQVARMERNKRSGRKHCQQICLMGLQVTISCWYNTMMLLANHTIKEHVYMH